MAGLEPGAGQAEGGLSTIAGIILYILLVGADAARTAARG